MSSTDGLTRGVKVLDTGAPISVPVGEVTLGRMFDVVGEPIDKQGDVKATKKYPIHRSSPKFTELHPSQPDESVQGIFYGVEARHDPCDVITEMFKDR